MQEEEDRLDYYQKKYRVDLSGWLSHAEAREMRDRVQARLPDGFKCHHRIEPFMGLGVAIERPGEFSDREKYMGWALDAKKPVAEIEAEFERLAKAKVVEWAAQ